MNSSIVKSPEHEADGPCIVWQPTLRTIFTKDDLIEIVAAIKAHDASKSSSTAPVSSASL